VKDFDTKKDDIMNRLVSMRDKIFSKANMIYGFTGNKELYNHLSLLFNEYYLKHKDKNIYTKVEFKENVKNEAFTAPIDVNYVSRGGKFTDKYNGGLLVLDNAMSLEYLWMQVRVQGGAYGCMMSIDPTGYIRFTSYIDPNNKKTNDVYDASYRFVEEFNPSDEQLLKFKIGATGNSESVIHVRDKADTASSFYLRGLCYCERYKNRSAILSITKEEIKGFSTMFKEAMADYTISRIGNTDKINEVRDMFKEIRTVSKKRCE
jgi:Zn-dependent M16 (insulinase) family peptidase